MNFTKTDVDDYLDGGEPGCCDFEPNTGDDWLYGGNGNDEIHTSDFHVLGGYLYGENGSDTIFVWSGGFFLTGPVSTATRIFQRLPGLLSCTG